MKIVSRCILFSVLLWSCAGSPGTSKPNNLAIQGTWKLISGTLIEKGDTLVTDYTKDVSFIKIINETHFSFLHHDLKHGKDSAAVFSAGGGSYNLQDSTYTEHLEYCSARAWEGHDFEFTLTVTEDTFIQRGIEKIESEGIDRINIEKYHRVKN
ncbi:MAG: hypothetical protein SH818_12340 [Saprospiraceae bacterium]|nr:hypothetical protein [Saprospiraceae bacterium]